MDKVTKEENKKETETNIKTNDEKEDKKSTDKISIVKSAFEGVKCVGKIVYDFWDSKQKNELEKFKLKHELEIKKREIEIEKFKLEQKKKEEEEEKQKQKIIEGNKEWSKELIKIIESILKNMKYLDLVENTFNEIIKNFRLELIQKISSLFNNDNEQYKLLIKQKRDFIFNNIKDKIPKIETLNFMISGQSGIGKSCLLNSLLKKDLAKEGRGIKSGTQKFSRYENPEDVPGIALYDTIGVEPTNTYRNIKEIKALVKKTFEDNLQDPNKSLHGIIYCIKNGSDANRIEEGEINFIKELNDIYGNSNILTIAFTRTLSPKSKKTKERMNELLQQLNNKEIEIILVNAKEDIVEINDKEEKVPQFGLDELKKTMMKNAKKFIMAHLKYSTKKVMIEFYKNNTIEINNTIKNKLNNGEYENSFSKEAENILKNLFGEITFNFSEIFIDFTNIEKYITDNIEIVNEKMKNLLKEKYEDKGLNKLYEEFNNFNSKYDKKLDNSNIKESFINKFDEFFENEITKNINKIIIGKALVIFLDKSFEIISEITSDNISNEELERLANSNIDNLLEKINI